MKGRIQNLTDNTQYTVALAGNPNVGKSTVFNALTGMRQHTGNWPGKTVAGALGTFDTSVGKITLVDVPGTYSLTAHSAEEEVARDYICGSATGEEGSDDFRPSPDAVIIVCDACCLERNLILALQIMHTGTPSMLCINLMDEAASRGISVDTELLETELNVPCVPCAARQGEGLDKLTERLPEILTDGKKHTAKAVPNDREMREIVTKAELLAKKCTDIPVGANSRDRILDRIFTGKLTAFPIMTLLLAVVFFITLKGATPISDALSALLGYTEEGIRSLLEMIHVPQIIVSALCDGVLRVLCWVVAVMLPPMAIFFPLFTLLEDLGYLPRVAYNFDRCFKKCGACGKQALTIMMGFGCNAAGVTGCRIIDSPRERLIAMITNSFVPCNGRFPVLAALISVFAVGGALFQSFVMSSLIVLGIVLTLAVSFLLSKTLLRGTPSSFTLELPPYRAPRIGEVIVRSVFDRTLFVLGRAAAVAAPAGLLIWILGNININDTSLLAYITGFLEPVGRLAGMDGVIMCAFILALPAAEIIVPLMMLGYSAGGNLAPVQSLSEMADIFCANGWTNITVICALIFTLVHWPCSTTIITVKRETGSVFWAALSVVIPTLIGYALCVAVNLISKL